MFKKPCPWCDVKVGSWQLGSIPKKNKHFFTLLPNLAICPYCSNPVKVSGKSFYALFAFVPVILLSLLALIIEYDLPEWFVPVGAITMVFAFCFAMVFSVLKKDYDL